MSVVIPRELLEEVILQLDDFITGDILNRLRKVLEGPTDQYELWYSEAIEASNHLGFAGMSASSVIGYLGIENRELKEELERLAKQVGTQHD